MSGRRANLGWLGLGAYVLGHNVLAAGRGDEMLSMAVDRYLVRHPVVTHAVIGLVAGHLLNLLPPAVDPLAAVMGTLSRKIGPLR